MHWHRSLVALTVVAVVLLAAVAGAPAPAAGQSAANETGGAGAVVAQVVTSENAPAGYTSEGPFDRAFYRQISTVTTAYNGADTDLGPPGRLLRGKAVNMHVTARDGSEAVVSFRVTGDNRIENVRAGGRRTPGLTMHTDKRTIRRIASTESPGVAFREAIRDGRIRIRGTGFLGGLFWWGLNRLLF